MSKYCETCQKNCKTCLEQHFEHIIYIYMFVITEVYKAESLDKGYMWYLEIN